MPEGHLLHRIAREHRELLADRVVRASSPQGRFVAGARRIDGQRVDDVRAVGKHLFYEFAAIPDTLHIHLGIYGKFAIGGLPAPAAIGALRLRLLTRDVWIDLRGPMACDLLEPDGVDRILARLGPDPLARKPDPERAWERLRRSRAPIAAALMDQSVIAGIGNVFRAELLFRHRREPFAPANHLHRDDWQQMWDDLIPLLRSAMRSGRIVTTAREHRERRTGPARREDAHYVYRRHGLPCRLCGTIVQVAELAGRRLYWCPVCQIR